MEKAGHYNGGMATTQHPAKEAENLWHTIDAGISRALGEPFNSHRRSPLGGGCISSALRLDGQSQSVFLKLGSAGDGPMFDAEAEALQAIAATDTVRVPAVITRGESAESAWLALEYIDSAGPHNGTAAALGEQLAALHSCNDALFGWHRDNWIGATPQRNHRATDWPGFFTEHRLLAQLEMAAGNGLPGATVENGLKLAEAVPALLGDYRPAPSLLHGDLWAGNWACDQSGQPYLYDPASYYGDRDADIAMTELFGGFPDSFYRAYDAVSPRTPGYPIRRQLYNLYHVLNHFNLFGGGYGAQSGEMIGRLLAEAGA